MLTLQIVPYAEIAKLSSLGRIRKLLNMAKDGYLVLLEGRLTKEEEAELIKTTMEEINNEFKGIELAVVNNLEKEKSFLDVTRANFAKIILGNRTGFTIVGPATLVKQIKRDPHKIQVLLQEKKKSKGKGRK